MHRDPCSHCSGTILRQVSGEGSAAASCMGTCSRLSTAPITPVVRAPAPPPLPVLCVRWTSDLGTEGAIQELRRQGLQPLRTTMLSHSWRRQGFILTQAALGTGGGLRHAEEGVGPNVHNTLAIPGTTSGHHESHPGLTWPLQLCCAFP